MCVLNSFRFECRQLIQVLRRLIKKRLEVLFYAFCSTSRFSTKLIQVINFILEGQAFHSSWIWSKGLRKWFEVVFFLLQHKAKTKLMNEEMIFGSKPSTPVKRRFQPTNTPTKTPKYRKVIKILKLLWWLLSAVVSLNYPSLLFIPLRTKYKY